MTGFAVSALAERRREIQREIAYLEHEIKRCEEAIGHVDATIHLLDPAYDLTRLKPKKFVAEVASALAPFGRFISATVAQCVDHKSKGRG